MVKNEEKLKKVIADFNLKLVVLFGSQTTGKIHEKSDVDIAVLSPQKLDIQELSSLQVAFAEVFGRSDVEVADIRGASPLFLKEITHNGKVLYSKDPNEFAKLRMYGFKIFVETKPLREMRRVFLNNFVKNNG